MSLFAAAETRANQRGAYLPQTNIMSPMEWLLKAFGGGDTEAGVHVDPDNTVSLSTVFSALNYIQDTFADLPAATMIKEDREGIKNKYRRKFSEHPSHRLIARRPNKWMTSHTYRKVMMNHALRYDNAFAFIVRDGAARPKEIIPLPAKFYNVEPKITTSGEMMYRVTGRKIPLEETWLGTYDMIHIIGYTEDGYTGKCRVDLLREALGTTMAAENWAGKFYGKGVNVSGFIKTDKKLKDKNAVQRLKESFARVAAGPNNEFGVGVLEDGADWIQNETDPEKAQLNQTRKVNAITVSQIWKIPIVFLNHLERGTFNNVEQLGIWFSKFTLSPWCTNFQQEYWSKLLTEDEQQKDDIYFNHDLKALMRGDMAAFSQFVERIHKTGAYSPNMILELLDENGFEGGDVHVVSPGSTTIENLNNEEST